MKQFDERLRRYTDEIEGYLQQCFVEPEEPQQALFEAMRYSLLAGGKRLRPALTLACCALCGGKAEDALPFAAAVEMVHTYSLSHDDLPCMDNDDLRRGRPTNHKVYGEATAVLAGDGLLTAAFRFLTKAKLPASQIVRAVQVLSLCAGELGMVGGQVLDLAGEKLRLGADNIHTIHELNTGAPISAACRRGAAAAGANARQMEAARAYAAALGLAFQLRDDMLDVLGDAEKMGKATGMDANKNTFVALYGVGECSKMIERYTSEAVAALAPFSDTQFLSELAQRLALREY